MIVAAAQLKASWDAAVAAPTGTHLGLTAAQWEAKTREAVRNLEMMRGLYLVFGSAI
jgi:hypothetical protein